MSRDTVFICAGGTGGHVFPGLAVADALGSVTDAECRFLGTARGLESRLVPDHKGEELKAVNAILDQARPARGA